MNEIDRLRALSAKWGQDLSLVQGAGGNTSFKESGQLHVKASGKRLADALAQDIFVAVPLRAARSGEAQADATTGLRPSIETILHATMPHAVVAHLHMVEAIAMGARTDAKAVLAERLAGLVWTYVDYAKPGRQLAEAIGQVLDNGVVDVVVMANHGLLVGGPTCEDVERLVSEVQRRLSVEPRAPEIDRAALDRVAEQHDLEVARLDAAHWAALDATNFKYARSGTLYPDHVVFLGRSVRTLDDDRESSLILVPGVGALMLPGQGEDAHEMAACLGMVVSRIPPGVTLNVLGTADEDQIINWDAEKYRRSLSEHRG